MNPLDIGIYELLTIGVIAMFVIGMSATIVLALYILTQRIEQLVSRLEKLESEKENPTPSLPKSHSQ